MSGSQWETDEALALQRETAAEELRKMLTEQLEPLKSLNDALSKAQGEFPTIPRDKTVTTQSYSYSYSELSSIIAAVRPALADHGLSFVQLLEAEGLRTELRHKDGGQIVSVFPWPRIPDNPQQLGSLVTYLKRYTLTALLGIATEDDDDAQAATSQFKQPPARKPKTRKIRDETGEAVDEQPIVDYLSEPQRRKIHALKGKLIKADVFSEETFEKAVAAEYEGATVGALTRKQASHLIERLEKVERDVPAETQ